MSDDTNWAAVKPADFEKLGTERVRHGVNAALFSSSTLEPARRWLEQKDEASHAEQMNVARSSRNAAWAALFVAAIALLVSLFALFRPH
jgi:hypothetical protein